MGTTPFEITDPKPSSATGNLKNADKLPEKQLKELIKIEKLEKLEHKEKPEKIEHKEKPEKYEHKEKPEKYEHKEKPEKIEHKEKIEKHEHKELEKIQHVEKIQQIEGPVKTVSAEIPVINPGDPVEQGIAGRVGQLEQTVGQMQHFITANLRPDLSQGALKQEPDASDKRKG